MNKYNYEGCMTDWIRHHLSSEESQKACDRYADAILADSFLLSRFMENYDISQKGLDSYRDEIDRMEETVLWNDDKALS